MSVLTSETALPGAVASQVLVFDTLAEAEAPWRALEANGIFTPYQRFDWVRALLVSGAESQGRIAVAMLFEAGMPMLVAPLIVETKMGVSRGRLIGTYLSNADWLPVRRGFTPTPERLNQLWAAVGGLDLVSFYNLPAAWDGMANPLLGEGCDPSPNNFYYTQVVPTPGPYLETHMPAKKRANIKRGARRLEEGFGKVELRRVEDQGELDKVHATFLAQRGERFDQMGVGNVFAEPWFQLFFKSLAATGFGQDRPALRFHALYAGDEIVATSCGSFAGGHYSQYINSTASGPAAKFSLMGILLGELLDELARAGVTGFDMGTGDFDYKTDWTEAQALFNRHQPVTAKGAMAAQVLRSRQGLKRLIKQTPALWRLAKQVRLALYRLKGGK